MSEYIRLVKPDDSQEILNLYAPFITDTAVSFEYEIPGVQEFTDRIQHIAEEYPYLVYVKDERIIGYAYAHRYLERAAYQWDVEVTIYLADKAQGLGIGKRLYEALEELLQIQGIKNLYSCITASNEQSIKFHEKCGYRLIGTFNKAGYKAGCWQDVVWMEKNISPCLNNPQPPQKIKEAAEEKITAVLTKYQQ